jgi:hypothetical protein
VQVGRCTASIKHVAAFSRGRSVTRGPVASTLVRPAHELHGVFDMPPSTCQFRLAFCFEFDGILGGFRNGPRAMRFQQLPRIGMDFDFSHGVTLLLFGSSVTSSRQELQMLTPIKQSASEQEAFARASLGSFVANTRKHFPMD